MSAMMKRLIVAIVMVLVGLVLASPAQAYPTMPQGIQGPYTVLKVVDGDTIHVNANGQKLKIRMIGLDTPETVDPRKPVQCFGREASAQAKTILGGQSVYLETDPSQDTIDKYGRTLAYVWTASGRLFNLDMIAHGYAFEYTYDLPYRYRGGLQDRRGWRLSQRSWAVVTEYLCGITDLGHIAPRGKIHEEGNSRHRHRWRTPQRRIAGVWGSQRRRLLRELHRSVERRSGTTPRGR
jgi:endonuclease YncB( thermonuclease family)